VSDNPEGITNRYAFAEIHSPLSKDNFIGKEYENEAWFLIDVMFVALFASTTSWSRRFDNRCNVPLGVCRKMIASHLERWLP